MEYTAALLRSLLAFTVRQFIMWYDILILAILAYSTLRGAKTGIVWQLAVIGALVLCFAFAEPLSVVLAPVIPVTPPLNRWLAMLCIYFAFAFVSFAVAGKLRSWIEALKFVEYDRHVGAIFGFIKGVVFCLVLTFFVVTLSEKLRFEVLNSHSGHAAAVIMDRLHPIMPAELHDVLEPYIHQLDRPGMDLEHSHGASLNFGNHDHPKSFDSATEQGPSRRIGDHSNEHEMIGDKSLQDLISSIPQAIDNSLRELVLTAFKNTAPEDRRELLEKLRPGTFDSGTPDSLRPIALEWRNGKPKSLPR